MDDATKKLIDDAIFKKRKKEYTGSKNSFTKWLDAHDARKKRPASQNAKDAQELEREKARAAKEIPVPPELPKCPQCERQLQAKANASGMNYWRCPKCQTCYNEELTQAYVKKADGFSVWVPLDGQGTSDPASLTERASSRPASPTSGPDTSAQGTQDVVVNVAPDDDFQEV